MTVKSPVSTSSIQERHRCTTRSVSADKSNSVSKTASTENLENTARRWYNVQTCKFQIVRKARQDSRPICEDLVQKGYRDTYLLMDTRQRAEHFENAACFFPLAGLSSGEQSFLS